MTHLLARWLINALALLFTANLLREHIILEGFTAALVAAALLGIVNAIIRPVLLFLALPINILSLGLFTFVINGFMLVIVSNVVNGFELVGGFLWAVIAAAVLSLISSLISSVLRK
ncbi:MAG: phage holin family protein [Bacillota bacterium]